MAKMFEINGKMATQNAHMAFAAYNRAKALVPEYNGVIDFVDGKKIKATFKSNKMAKSFVTAFESEYAEASKAYQATKTDSKPTASKGKTPRKSKGKGFDFDSVKGKTNSEKNKALHAMLVAKGITNSKTEEYMSVWNARPWAK